MSLIKNVSVMGALIVMAGTVATTAHATSDKPINAALPESGEGCLVSDIGGGNLADYVPDSTCQYHLVVKRDKDGNVISLHYQDKGELQPGQTAPDQAIRNTWTEGPCELSETISPSGAYSSDAFCKV